MKMGIALVLVLGLLSLSNSASSCREDEEKNYIVNGDIQNPDNGAGWMS